jgi:hypothetical protein
MTTMTSPAAPPASPTRQLRRVIVRLTIGSFSVAALMGIIALLSGGEFGETEGRVLLTTLLVGVVSVAVLCYLATAGKSFQSVGIAGGVAVAVPFVLGLVMIWAGDTADQPWLYKPFLVFTIVAATLAQASLLLALCEKGRPLVRRILAATLVFATAVALMTSYLVIFEDRGVGVGDWYFRLLGVVAILDVLGTVTVAALMKFGPTTAEREVGSALALPPDLRARLDAAALAEGRSPTEVAADAVERYLGRPD